MRVHRWRFAAALGTAALTAGAMAAHAAGKTAQFDVTTVNVGQGAQVTVNSKMWITPTQARVDVKDPLQGKEVRFLVTNGAFYQLMPSAKQGVKGPLPPQMKKSKDNFDRLFATLAFDAGDVLKKGKKVRTESISGYDCDVYHISETQGDESRSLSIWMPQKMEPRLPLKAVRSVKISKPGALVETTITITLSNVKLNQPIPASVFAVPTGYKIQAGKPNVPKAAKVGK